MKRILVVQSRVRPEMVAAEQGEYKRAIGEDYKVSFVSSLDGALPWDDPKAMLKEFDGVMIGGSGEFDFDGGRTENDPAKKTAHAIAKSMRPFVEFILDRDFPLLAICFGHQIVAEVSGVSVMHDQAQKKIGSFEVELTQEGKEDKLFGDMPAHFIGQYGHKDSLSDLPKGALLIARSPLCRYSALRYGSNVYTTQFHPELTANDVKWKLQNSPGYLPEGVDINSLIKPSPFASSLIPNFVERIVGER